MDKGPGGLQFMGSQRVGHKSPRMEMERLSTACGEHGARVDIGRPIVIGKNKSDSTDLLYLLNLCLLLLCFKLKNVAYSLKYSTG